MALALLGLAALVLFFRRLELARPHREPDRVVSQATRLAQAMGFDPGPAGATVYHARQGLLWAWELAARRSDAGPLGPVATVHFLGGGEVGLQGDNVVRFRRPLPTDPGAAIPPALLAEQLPLKLAPLVPEVAGFTWQRLAFRQEAGMTWHRANLVRSGGTLPAGWQEELEVEVAGSTVIAMSRRLVPDPDPMGVVLGRTAELARARWLALLAAGMGVLGLFVATAEAFWFRLRLPWLESLFFSALCFALGRGAGHSTGVSLFWAVVVLLSALVLGGMGVSGSRGGRLYATAGLALAGSSLLWPKVVLAAGGWLPRTGAVVTEAWWVVAAEAAFRALGEEPLLRGGIPWLLRSFLGRSAGAVLAAGVGSLLHPLPAVPLPYGILGEFLGQGALGWLAYRQGWGSAVGARLVWELLRLGYFAPQFPWGTAWQVLVLWALGSLVWPTRRR